MDQFRIVGPTRIAGRVSASGAKNAALPELAASLLSDEPVRLDGVPRVLRPGSITLTQLRAVVPGATEGPAAVVPRVPPTPITSPRFRRADG